MTQPSPPATPGNTSLRTIRYGVFIALGLALVIYPFVRRGGNSPASPFTTPVPITSSLSAADAALATSLQMYQAGRYQESIAAANDALSANPNMAEAYNNIGVAWIKLKNFDEADTALKRALQLKPDFELARNNVAWLERERVAATRPPDPTSYEWQLTRSLDAYQAGRFDESIEAAEKALALRPDSAEAFNNIAAGRAAKGEWDAAIAAAQQAIRLKPDFQLAKNNLAWAERGKAGLAK